MLVDDFYLLLSYYYRNFLTGVYGLDGFFYCDLNTLKLLLFLKFLTTGVISSSSLDSYLPLFFYNDLYISIF